VDEFRVSTRRACAVVLLARSTFRYTPRPSPVNHALASRMREIALTRVRYGMWRIYVLLRREGWSVNHKRVHRLYKLAGLHLRSKRPRRNRAGAHRLERVEATRPHESWSMDFVSDALFDGRRFRALTIVDNFSRQCLAIHVDASIRGHDVTAIVSAICAQHGQIPERIQVDNGSEFISRALDKWAYDNDVTLDFSRPGKPTDNPYIESFNGSFRDECLNLHWFLSLEDAREKIEAWRRDYNAFRPHLAFDGLSPDMFIENHLRTTADSLLLTG
jgi:putative transposase